MRLTVYKRLDDQCCGTLKFSLYKKHLQLKNFGLYLQVFYKKNISTGKFRLAHRVLTKLKTNTIENATNSHQDN